MALQKYNFGIRSKVKVGRIQKRPYLIAFFENNNDALDFAATYEQFLANKAKMSVTVSMVAIGNEEITPNIELEDTKDFQVMAKYKHPTAAEYDSETERIVIPGLKTSVTEAEVKQMVLTMSTVDGQGNEQNYNEIISIIPRVNNVVSGGPATEQLTPVHLP